MKTFMIGMQLWGKKKRLKNRFQCFAIQGLICFLIHALNKPLINLEPWRKGTRLPFSPQGRTSHFGKFEEDLRWYFISVFERLH